MTKAVSFFIICFTFFFLQIPFCREYTVSDSSGIQKAAEKASAGDSIVLQNGTYMDVTLRISGHDITVRAETPGNVILTGSISITITGDRVTFTGFQFLSAVSRGILITVEGTGDILSDLYFNSCSAKKYISLAGQHDVVTHCCFENKPDSAPKGNLVHIATRKDGLPGYELIQYCLFRNIPGKGGDNGNECIRITDAEPASYISETTIEYCFFTNTGGGDSEAISVKSAGNVIRYNVMSDNPSANFCFRRGSSNSAYGNYFSRSGGIRIKEAGSITCTDNYFRDCGDGHITAPVKYVSGSGPHEKISFMRNTVAGGTSIELCGDAKDNTWSENIFVNTSCPIFTGSSAGIVFAENKYAGILGLPDAEGFKKTEDSLDAAPVQPVRLSDTGPSYVNNR